MDSIDQLKIEIFDLQREQEKHTYLAREAGRKKTEKIQQLEKMEGIKVGKSGAE